MIRALHALKRTPKLVAGIGGLQGEPTKYEAEFNPRLKSCLILVVVRESNHSSWAILIGPTTKRAALSKLVTLMMI